MDEKEPLQRPKVPRTFLTRAYLLPLERNLYGLFRHVEQENPETGKREKVGEPLGPIRLLRPARKDEEKKVVVRTVHPKTGEMIELVEFEG